MVILKNIKKTKTDISADYYIEDPLELRDYIRDNFSKFKKNKK